MPSPSEHRNADTSAHSTVSQHGAAAPPHTRGIRRHHRALHRHDYLPFDRDPSLVLGRALFLDPVPMVLFHLLVALPHLQSAHMQPGAKSTSRAGACARV